MKLTGIMGMGLGVMMAMQQALAGGAPFGKTADGQAVELYTLKNVAGMTATIMTRGATVVSLLVPDRNGMFADVVNGFDTVAGYESDDNQYFGCATGRVANRIAKGKYKVNGVEYQAPVNNGPNALHGGVKRSLDKVVWAATEVEPGRKVRFHYTSPDGEEGYPGALDCTITYTLTDKNGLQIDYSATTTKSTPVNLTNHSYFNLAGAGAPTVLDHLLTLHCSRYTPADDTLIPTGKIDAVAGTPLDFTKPTRIGARIDQLVGTAFLGYDHNMVIDGPAGTLRPAAKLVEPKSGRVMTVLTTEPGVQFYSGNFLKGQKGKAGKTYAQRSALCLETQHYPDSVNRPEFPSTILEPGKTYTHTCVYEFGVEK